MRLVRRLGHCQEPSGFFARPLEKAADRRTPPEPLELPEPDYLRRSGSSRQSPQT